MSRRRKTVTYNTYNRVYTNRGRRYGFWNFFWDALLTCATGGLWIIWIVIREWRTR